MPLPSSPAGPSGIDFSNLVASQIGTPYVWGGDKPGGFDCSGLVYWAAHMLGINAPRTSEEQWGWVQRIQGDQLQPGDLIFLNFPGEVSPGHVVIYAGGNQIIQAPSTGQLVQRDTWGPGTAAQWGATIVGYGRIPGLSYAGEPKGGGTGTAVGGQVPGGGGSSFWTSVDSSVTSILQSVLPAGSALGSLIAGLGPGGGIGALLGELIQVIDWTLHPSHWIRIFAGIAGAVLVFMGVWSLTHVSGAA